MKRLGQILILLFVGALCSGFHPITANADGLGTSQIIVTFHEDISWPAVMDYAAEWKIDGVSLVKELPIINALVLSVPPNISIADLTADSRVADAEIDQTVKMQSGVQGNFASFIQQAPKPPKGHYPWGILKLYGHSYDPWSLTSAYENDALSDTVELGLDLLESEKIRIAIFDTGIFFFNGHLMKLVKGGIDLVNDDQPKKWYTKLKNGAPLDDNGHGTHVAGIIGAALDPCGKWGRKAKVELYAVKMLDQNAMGDLSNVIVGLQWAIDNDIDIVNMSIGYRQDSPAVAKAVRTAYEFGIVLIASVGNHSNWDQSIVLAADGGAADGGAADGGAADGGAADGGAADGGAADGGAADGGAADGGAADGGAADGGAADGGAADGGAADGGAADGGAADGGAADGGAADGGAADGGAADGGAADGGAADGGAADGGAADGGAADGGAADGGAAEEPSEIHPIFSVMYPARYPEVIAVGASTPFGEPAHYNNTGIETDVFAPGSQVISADITNGNVFNGFGVCSGTSQAAAHVTASVALMLSIDPSLSPREISDILIATAKKLEDGTTGEIDLIAALEKVMITSAYSTTGNHLAEEPKQLDEND